MILIGRDVRALGRNASTMEAAASEVTSYLYNCFRDPTTQKSLCALIRCFTTHPYEHLPPPLQSIAAQGLGDAAPAPGLRCLTLLATNGDQPAWNDRHASLSHQVIPLPTTHVLEQAPMISQMILQMGLELSQVVEPASTLRTDAARRSFQVFHVENAPGHPFVPAQHDFVGPAGIQSVLGFGGMLTSGEIFAVVMFSKVHISRETAQLFRTLALNVKLVFLPFSGRRIFASET